MGKSRAPPCPLTQAIWSGWDSSGKLKLKPDVHRVRMEAVKMTTNRVSNMVVYSDVVKLGCTQVSIPTKHISQTKKLKIGPLPFSKFFFSFSKLSYKINEERELIMNPHYSSPLSPTSTPENPPGVQRKKKRKKTTIYNRVSRQPKTHLRTWEAISNSGSPPHTYGSWIRLM